MRSLVATAVTVALTGAAACAPAPDGETPTSAPTPTSGPVVLSFAVQGSPTVIAAYTRIAADYSAQNPNVIVNVKPYDDARSARRALRAAEGEGRLPDVFQIGHTDLNWWHANDAIEPVDEYLVEREVDFGDEFPRSGLTAFTRDTRLQCLPTEVSPLVAYVNTSLVNLPELLGDANGEFDPLSGWSLEELAEAARQASRGKNHGVHIAPELEQVGPMLLSGGGQVVDDEQDPTSLAMAEDSTREAWQEILEVVRNPRLTLSERQVEVRSPVERFQRGQLGIVLGHRDLTAKLRQQGGLSFAVLPIPKLGSQVTTARMSAMCIPKQTEDGEKGTAELASDFLAYLVSEEPMETLAATGEFVPVNLNVVNSPAFTQPNLMPQYAGVFANQMRRVRTLPDGPGWPTVYAQANEAIATLFYDPVIEPLQERLQEIDEASAATLATLTGEQSEEPDDETGDAGE